MDAKTIIPLDIKLLETFIQAHEENYCVRGNIYMALSQFGSGKTSLERNQPYRVAEDRFLLVIQGCSRCLIDLKELHFQPGSMAFVRQESVFEILDFSDDLNIMGMTMVDDLFGLNVGGNLFLPSIDDKDLKVIESILGTIWRLLHNEPVPTDIIAHLQAAVLLKLQQLDAIQPPVKCGRQNELFNMFLEQVNTQGHIKRNIAFYADKLCITPNHLSAIVKQCSGLTVTQWINCRAVQQAKIMLRYSDQPIWEIAEQMEFANASFFTSFFRRETGLTPMQYRLNQQA